MCLIWRVVYTCHPKHFLNVKRSKCRGITKTSKIDKFDKEGNLRPKSSACIQEPAVYFYPAQKCGPCTLQDVEDALDEQQDTIKRHIAPHYTQEMIAAAHQKIDEIEESKIAARFQIPKMNWQAPEDIVYGRRPGEKSRSKEPRTRTLLDREVQPEDVCGADMFDVVPSNVEVRCGGWDDKDWGSEFKKLGEELDEDRCNAVSSDEDLEVGQDTDESKDESEDEAEQDVETDTADDEDDTTSDYIEADDFTTPNPTTSTSPACHEPVDTTASTTASFTPPHRRPNGPQATVSSSAETCNSVVHGPLADRSTQQIAPTSACLTDNIEKQSISRVRLDKTHIVRTDNVANTKTFDGGFKLLAMQIVSSWGC